MDVIENRPNDSIVAESQVILYTDDASRFPDYEARVDPSKEPRRRGVRVSLYAPVKNEVAEIDRWLSAILKLTRRPDEIVIVDGGSTDGTVARLRELSEDYPVPITLIEGIKGGIACQRNVAVRRARYEIVVGLDFGCEPEPRWLERMVTPFEIDPSIDVVAGNTIPARADGKPLRHPKWWWHWGIQDPRTYLPPGHAMAFTRSAWQRVGGFPEWLRETGEDTYFGMALRKAGAKWALVPDAVVYWHAPDSLGHYLKKVYRWARGDGLGGLYAERYRTLRRDLGKRVIHTLMTGVGMVLMVQSAVLWRLGGIFLGAGGIWGWNRWFQWLKRAGFTWNDSGWILLSWVCMVTGYDVGRVKRSFVSTDEEP